MQLAYVFFLPRPKCVELLPVVGIVVFVVCVIRRQLIKDMLLQLKGVGDEVGCVGMQGRAELRRGKGGGLSTDGTLTV